MSKRSGCMLLGQVAHIIDPHPSHRAPEEVTYGVPFAGIGDLTEAGELLDGKGRIVPTSTLDEHKLRYKISSKTIGFGRVASIGKLIDFRRDINDLTISPTMAIVQPFAVEKDFLLAALDGELVKKRIDQWLTGSTRSSLGIELLREIELPEFSQKQQMFIGQVYRSLVNSIEKTEQLIEKYQQIKAGLMHDLFTRGIGADGQLRPPREQAPELYQHTPIGWIPKEWNVMNLNDVAEVIDPQPDHRTPPEMPDGIPYIGIGDFDEFGEIDFQKCRKISLEAYNKQKARFTAREGDIIFGKIGTIGQPKALTSGEFAVSANVVLIQPIDSPEFLKLLLGSQIFLKQISDITNTTSQPSLGIEKIRTIKVMVPKRVDEVFFIEACIKANNDKLRCELLELTKLKKQKSGLMHDLLTGTVPVSVDSVSEVTA